MNRPLRGVTLGVALSGVALCAACGSGQPAGQLGAARGPASVLCYSDESQDVVRLSGVFVVKNPRDLSEPWRIEFRRYLGQSGNEGAVAVSCSTVNASDPAAALKEHADALRQKNKKVVETGWTYAN